MTLVEKRKPHFDLSQAQSLGKSSQTRTMSGVAHAGAQAMGMEKSHMWRCLQELTAADFYKSMTSYANSKVWQDVYKTEYRGYHVYLKLQVFDDSVVHLIAFKEDENA